ncbi:MAG: xylose isomerase [Saprospiraceae bacterium]|nr:xylose isomerase [Saprospiraceae bacterium]
MSYLIGKKEYYNSIRNIVFEGEESSNMLAFRWYDANKVIAGRPMKDHLRFACAYWHSFCNNGADPFGEATHFYTWNQNSDPLERGKAKADAAFEFFTKMGIPFYCFHDMDVIDFTHDIRDNEYRLKSITEYLNKKQQDSGVKLLWGTANLFSNKKYMNGAATNPDFYILTHAALQVKAAIDATIALDGQNYVFWGGREGYMSLINTNMKREKEHLARFLSLSRDYARKKGFTGTFFIEPKPNEPTKHQYDYDAETVIGFLRQYDLLDDFKLNIEVNHATLAGHSFTHELQVAADAGVLGSIDANRGDYQNGWDTDQFPNNIYEISEAMLIILQAGGFSTGGINFDAKIRRNSADQDDIFYAHIGGMDMFARGLIVADNILKNSDYKDIVRIRYASFDSDKGRAFESGLVDLEALRDIAVDINEPELKSGKQEYLENLINRFI